MKKNLLIAMLILCGNIHQLCLGQIQSMGFVQRYVNPRIEYEEERRINQLKNNISNRFPSLVIINSVINMASCATNTPNEGDRVSSFS